MNSMGSGWKGFVVESFNFICFQKGDLYIFLLIYVMAITLPDANNPPGVVHFS